MSQLDGITILCEGIDQGPDVRLLETARLALKVSVALAGVVTFRPAGSKGDLRQTVKALQEVQPAVPVYAIRDRDFLIKPLLSEMRETAQRKPNEAAWPLSRHAIESYLIEPAFVEKALGMSGVAKLLEPLASERLWHDAGRATLERAAYEARHARPHLDEAIRDKSAVLGAIVAELGKWKTSIASLPSASAPEMVCGEFVEDFSLDPLWTRVDGKALLKALGHALAHDGILGALLHYAEDSGPPEPLVVDVGLFIAGLAAKQ